MWPLAQLAVDGMTDAQLAENYKTFNPKIVEIPLLAGKVHPVLAGYIEARTRKMRGARGDAGFLSNRDADVPPAVYYNPLNGPAAYVVERGNRASVF